MSAPPAKASKRYKLGGTPAPLNAEPPFTCERIRNVLSKSLGPRYNLPDDAKTRELCDVLNFWHDVFYRAQEERKFNVAAKEAKAALDNLIVLMPEILTDLHGRNARDNGQDQFTLWMLKGAEKLASCLTPTGLGFLQPYDLPEQARDWRWLIKVLPVDIGSAIESANPGYEGGRTKGGPLSRILAEIIPHITGEPVTAIAVGNQLILVPATEREKPARPGNASSDILADQSILG